ncbi:MAG: transposase [Anaerolineales bacterium]
MPIKRVHLIPDHYYHIYNKAVTDNLLFNEEKNYRFFISKIQEYLPDTAKVLAYCLMPNHYHLIVQIKNCDFPSSMRRLALSYVVAYNNFYDRKGHLFSGRYQRKHVEDLRYLLHLSRHIHLNPVKAKLVTKAEEWKYSSYREFIGLTRPVFVNQSIILELINDYQTSTLSNLQSDYKEFVEDWDFEYMSFKVK